MNPKILIVLSVAIALAGCGTTGGVMSIGPDTFAVTASKHNMSGGAPEAQSNALSVANAHCASLGKTMLATNTSNSYQQPFNNYSVTFRCLNQNDPELARPNMLKQPDVVIEDRRR